MARLSKFSTSISRVDNLEFKYSQLFKLTEVEIEQQEIAGDFNNVPHVLEAMQ